MKRRSCYAVVMAGGHGTRFWPAARRARPKQFLPLARGTSFLQATVQRVLPLVGWDRLLVVTAADHAHLVSEQLPELPSDQIIVEPEGRNTAACLTLAARWIEQHDDDAVMMAMPADHVIRDAAGFRRCLKTAREMALSGETLVVIGVEPTRPETGFGYVECAGEVAGQARVDWVRRFHEKPALPTARRYQRSGRHLWNAGMFVWRTSVLRAAMTQVAPEYFEQLDPAFRRSVKSPSPGLAKLYRKVPKQPIDVALMQEITAHPRPVARVAAVRATFDWMDAGSWDALAELWPKDDGGNAHQGTVIALDSSDCIVSAGERPAVLLGVSDLVIVDTPDALLVCSRARTQDVRDVPAELRRRKLAEVT